MKSGFSGGVPARTVAIAAIGAALLATAGCTRIRDHHGYIADSQLIQSVQAGVDNRESVLRTLGRPSFESEFDKNSWYYVSRNTEQFGFTTPKAKRQQLLIVSFDASGTVSAVQQRGLEEVVDVGMVGDKTPTLGREKSFLQDIFGNIGRVGGAGPGAGPSADNP